MGGDKHLLGRPVQTLGQPTSPKQNSLPKIGWSPQRVVTKLKNLHGNVIFYFYSILMFVKYLSLEIV